VNNRPLINNDKCVECGNCIAACPVQAVAGIFPKRTVIQNKLLVTGEHLPTVKEMLVLYKKGVSEIIGEDSSLTESWLQVIKEANSILHQLGEDSFNVSDKAFEKTEEVYSRRELFTQWKKESQTLVKQFAPAKWRFNHKDLDVAKYYPDYQFTKITLNPDKCTLCKACEVLCEKKCLNITDSSFSIAAQACSSCRLCVEICPEKAISLEEKISKVQDIHYPIYKRKCSICNQVYDSFHEYGEKCTTCTNGYLSPYIS
jgi:formate hydrogenlyase subunit 6/NADH:ubiquinone oxidoreductase subunit I